MLRRLNDNIDKFTKTETMTSKNKSLPMSAINTAVTDMQKPTTRTKDKNTKIWQYWMYIANEYIEQHN